jgi:hypothetical protein
VILAAASMAAILAGDAPYADPVNLEAFAPPASAEPAQDTFTGWLRFSATPADARSRLVADPWKIAMHDSTWAVPPTFDFAFVQEDGHLVPVERGIVAGDGIWWDWVVGPGRVWQDGDTGWSRAAVPFALMEKNANCLHNGVLTFRFRGAAEVSRVAWQVSGETCHYFQFDAWGSAPAVREPGVTLDAAAVGAAYRNEVARRLPVRPIAQLREDFPGLDPASFGSSRDIPPGEMTAFGLLVRGVHYAGGCETRAGAYPYCDEMLLPSYSLAKTVLAGFALMRAERLQPGARSALVTDYVRECREAGGWEGVRFEHLLDMATGRYDSPENEADEDASNTSRFFLSTTHDEKIRIACTRYPRKEPPGKRFVYHTTDTYLLGTGLAAWWREREGHDSDFYEDLLLEPVFRRLGLSPELATPRRTTDGVAQPFTGWGLVLRRDDLVKLGGFLSLAEGRLGDEALLDTAMVRAALQRDPKDPGYRAADGVLRYNHGVWAWDISRFTGCRFPAWIPHLSGYGGISVAMPPNGIVYYYVSDGGKFSWARAVAETQLLGAVCAEGRPDER